MATTAATTTKQGPATPSSKLSMNKPAIPKFLQFVFGGASGKWKAPFPNFLSLITGTQLTWSHVVIDAK